MSGLRAASRPVGVLRARLPALSQALLSRALTAGSVQKIRLCANLEKKKKKREGRKKSKLGSIVFTLGVVFF